MAEAPKPNPSKGRLISHFEDRNRDKQSQGWSELWESDESDLWDRGKPSPALIDFIESDKTIIHKRSNHRLRALVPGCGKGYDVVMLALHGFDAFGLEVSQKAVDTANEYAERQLSQPSAYNFSENHSRTQDGARGNVKFICGDFFQRDWEEQCQSEGERGFDIIYDYTFLCALLPEMRKDWARRMQELLSPSGSLICLEFPLYKDLKATGPPWSLKGVHWNLLAEGGDGIISTLEEKADPSVSKGQFQRVVYVKPERTYKVGQGSDMLSVWSFRQTTKV